MGQACSELKDVPKPNPKRPDLNICSEIPPTYEEASKGRDPTGTTFRVAPNFCVPWQAGKPSLPVSFNDFARRAYDDPKEYNKQLIQQINDFRFKLDRNQDTRDVNAGTSIEKVPDYSNRVSKHNTNSALDSQFCNNIGDTIDTDNFKDTEWTVQDQSGLCHYNDGDMGYATGKNLCCGWQCSISGTRTRCVRQNFRADPLVCCFNDYDCDKTKTNNCFQTPKRQRTCHPNFRDLSSESCRDIIYDYCIGNKLLPTQKDWLEMWLEDSYVELNSTMLIEAINETAEGHFNSRYNLKERARLYPGKEKQPCLRAIARAVTNSKICSFEDLANTAVVDAIYDSDGFQWSKKLLQEVFNKYRDEGGEFLGGINTDGINRQSSFQTTFWKICNKIPGLCTDILLDTCGSYTSDEIAENPNLWPWCSCYLKDSEYSKYTKYNIQRECSPLCNRDGVIPLITTKGQIKYCLQNVCLLDSVTVKLINTDVSGSVNFNQICGSCGDNNVKQRYHRKETDESNESNSVNITIKKKIVDNFLEIFGSGYEKWTKNINDTPECYIMDVESYNKIENKLEDTNYVEGIIKNFPTGKIYTTSYKNITGVYELKADGVEDNDKLINGKPIVLNIYKVNFTGGGVAYRKFTSEKPAIPILVKSKGDIDSSRISKSSTKSGQAEYGVSVNRCSCIIDGDTYNGFNSKIFGNINFNSNCDKLKCYDEAGDEIACSSDKDKKVPVPKIDDILAETRTTLEKEKYSRIFIIFLGIAIILFIMEFFKFILNRF